MLDRREAILSRLLEIASDVSDVKSVSRNKLSWAAAIAAAAAIGGGDKSNTLALGGREKLGTFDANLPNITIFDGDEEADKEDPVGSRPTTAPRRVTLKPEILIQLDPTGVDDLGTDLNTIRGEFLNAILADTALTLLVLNRLGMTYLGCSTDLGHQRSLRGQMWLHLHFTYPLFQDELTGD